MPIPRKSSAFRVVYGLLMLISTVLSLLNVGSRRSLCSSRFFIGVRTRRTGRGKSARNSDKSGVNDSKDLIKQIDRIINSGKKSLKKDGRLKLGRNYPKDRDGFELNNMVHAEDRFSEGKQPILMKQAPINL